MKHLLDFTGLLHRYFVLINDHSIVFSKNMLNFEGYTVADERAVWKLFQQNKQIAIGKVTIEDIDVFEIRFGDLESPTGIFNMYPIPNNNPTLILKAIEVFVGDNELGCVLKRMTDEEIRRRANEMTYGRRLPEVHTISPIIPPPPLPAQDFTEDRKQFRWWMCLLAFVVGMGIIAAGLSTK